MLSDSFKQGKLPVSFSDGSITLILKKGKDPTKCASYRPISLCQNSDLAINFSNAKVTARRLEMFCPILYQNIKLGLLKLVNSFFNTRRLGT